VDIQDVTPAERTPPAVIKVREVPAAVEARDALLTAIAQDTRAVVDKQPGQASAALLQLAQAYALLATATVPVATDGTVAPVQGRAGGHQVGLCLELEP
jgi:multidrug resistance efflux pump